MLSSSTLNTPGIDGLKLAKSIKAAARLRSTRLIMLSSSPVRLEGTKARDIDIVLTVKVSPKTLNSVDIAQQLRELVADYPINDGSLVIEITETAAIAHIEQAHDLAHDLRALGCRIAIDDFGAGFATFYYLKHLKFDFVKIDGEFIKNLSHDTVEPPPTPGHRPPAARG